MRKTVTRCAVIMVVTFLDHPCLVSVFSSTAGIVSNLDCTLKGDRLTNVPAAGKDWVEGATVPRESA